MFEPTPYLVEPYAALAAVYDRAGYSDFSGRMVSRYIACAQAMDWAGRRIIDVGCGTGVSSIWLAQQGYRVAAVDNNPHMLAQAQLSASSTDLIGDPPEYVQMDVRALESPLGQVDLVLTIGSVLNAIQSLRELEVAFRSVFQVLIPGRLFMFDLLTMRGLAGQGTANGDTASIYDNGDDLMITMRDHFSFELTSRQRLYTIWQRSGDLWQRCDELHLERGFPVQAVNALLERVGFRVAAQLNVALEPFDAETDEFGRVVFVAQRPDGAE